MKVSPPVAIVVSFVVVIALGGAVEWWRWSVSSQVGRARALTREELWKLPTFHRECDKAEDCMPPLSCIRDDRVNLLRCLGSECNTAGDCEPGFMCLEIGGLGPPIRQCVVEGTRGEGERCEYFPLKPEQGCQPGLLCRRSFCGRPCRLGQPDACPEGHACLGNDRQMPACVPTCLKTGCPPGKRCFQIDGDFAACGELTGFDCETNRCPAGRECARNLVGMTDKVFHWCNMPCDETKPCPKGLLCFDDSCLKPCGPDRRDICGPHEECAFYPQDRLWLCSPN